LKQVQQLHQQIIINPPIIVVDTFLTGFWFETSFEKKRLATHF